MSIHPLRHLNLIMIHPIELNPPIHIRSGHNLPFLIPKTKIPIQKISLDPISGSGFKQPRHAKSPFPLHVDIESVHKTDEFLLHPADFSAVAVAIEIVGRSGRDEDSVHGDEGLTRGGGFDAHFVFTGEVEHGASDANEVGVLIVGNFCNVEVFAGEGDSGRLKMSCDVYFCDMCCVFGLELLHGNHIVHFTWEMLTKRLQSSIK